MTPTAQPGIPETARAPAAAVAGAPRRDGTPAIRLLAVGLLALAAGLAINTLLGPLVLDLVSYPFSESTRNQTLGLEAVSLFLVAPVCLAAGILAWRGSRAGIVLALGPATYTAYMFVQYVIGPQYAHYPRALVLHLGLFVLGMVVATGAWAMVSAGDLPAIGPTAARRRGIVLCLLAAFVVSRYLPALAGSWPEEPLPAEYAADPSMFWTILLLDLGIVVPALVATAVALFRGAATGHKAAYALLGWFALVPPSVAAMSVAMVAAGDPNASVGQMAIFIVAAVAFSAYALAAHRPLFRRVAPPEEPARAPARPATPTGG